MKFDVVIKSLLDFKTNSNPFFTQCLFTLLHLAPKEVREQIQALFPSHQEVSVLCQLLAHQPKQIKKESEIRIPPCLKVAIEIE